MVKPAPQTIRITSKNWEGLASVAEPFEPPCEVIDRLVDLYQQIMSAAKPGETTVDVARRLLGVSVRPPQTRPEPPPQPSPPPTLRLPQPRVEDIILMCLPGPREAYQQSAEIRTRMAPHLGKRPTHIHPDLMRLANQGLVETEKPNGWGYRLTPQGEARKNEIQG